MGAFLRYNIEKGRTSSKSVSETKHTPFKSGCVRSLPFVPAWNNLQCFNFEIPSMGSTLVHIIRHGGLPRDDVSDTMRVPTLLCVNLPL